MRKIEFFLPKYFVSPKIVLNFATANGNQRFYDLQEKLEDCLFSSVGQST